jgi:hypothetical protein
MKLWNEVPEKNEIIEKTITASRRSVAKNFMATSSVI